MIRSARLGLVALLLALLLSSAPALAQGENPAVQDLGNNIYLLDGNQGPIPNLMSAADVQKIAQLQSAPVGSGNLVIETPVSPDDQTVLVRRGAVERFFLNVRDGSTRPVQVSQIFSPLSNLIWFDADRVGGFAMVLVDGKSRTEVVTLDRRDGSLLIGGDNNGLRAGAGMGRPIRISPDGSKLLLASGPDGSDPTPDGATTLNVRDLPSAQARTVATIPAGSEIVDASFSPDGSKLSVVSQRFDEVAARAFDGALLSSVAYRDVTGNLPQAQNPYFQSNTLTVFDFPSGQAQTLRAAHGDGAVFARSSWSTDNQTLVVKMHTPGRAQGRRYPQYYPQFLSGSHMRFYTSALQEFRRLERSEISDRESSVGFVSPDELIITGQDRLDQHAFYYNLRSGEFRRISDRPGTFAAVTPTNSSREIIFAYSSYTDPVDFHRMRWDGTAFTRITWVNEAVRQLNQTRQYPVSFTLRDGSIHTGVLILPAEVAFPPRNVPIVVWQEGGPTVAVQNSWFAVVESPHALLPNFGFGVLVVPLYGRVGVGPERFNALANGANFGAIDIDAQAEIARQLKARGWASKVGITGCSYGGYFVTQSLVRHPATYDAGHTMCSLIDLIVEWKRGFPVLYQWTMGLPPHAALEEYRRDSPAYNAGRVRTPLLAFHGTGDFIPITLMENFMLEVINTGTPAKLLKFQGATHGFLASSPKLAVAYELYGAQEQILWFRQYLGQ